MGQFSVEICHLVGQFSMKLNTQTLDRRTHNRLAQSLSSPHQGLGEPQ